MVTSSPAPPLQPGLWRDVVLEPATTLVPLQQQLLARALLHLLLLERVHSEAPQGAPVGRGSALVPRLPTASAGVPQSLRPPAHLPPLHQHVRQQQAQAQAQRQAAAVQASSAQVLRSTFPLRSAPEALGMLRTALAEAAPAAGSSSPSSSSSSIVASPPPPPGAMLEFIASAAALVAAAATHSALPGLFVDIHDIRLKALSHGVVRKRGTSAARQNAARAAAPGGLLGGAGGVVAAAAQGVSKFRAAVPSSAEEVWGGPPAETLELLLGMRNNHRIVALLRGGAATQIARQRPRMRQWRRL